MRSWGTVSPAPAGRVTHALLLLLGLGLLAWNVDRSPGFLADDALISLRYSARLVAGQGLTWTDGERVEGYSNLLWILLVAIPGTLGVDLVRAAIGLGIACASGVVLVVGRMLRPAGWVAELGGVLLTALSAPLGAWGRGGLEGPLQALLVLGATALLAPLSAGAEARRRLVPAGLLLGLACWTRPDTPILVAGLAGGMWLATGQDRAALRRSAVIAAVPAAFFAAQLLFRVAYYGDWVPNTAHAKLDVASLDRAELGVLYVWPWLRAGGWLWLAAVPLLWAPSRPVRDLGRVLLPVLGLHLAWLLWIGGDHFVAWRLLLVLDPLRDVLAALGVAVGVGRLGRWAPLAGLPLLAALTAWHVQAQEHENAIAMLRVRHHWEWDAEPPGRLLGAAFGQTRPLLATCAAGGLPFWSGLPALDPLGLTDRHIAQKRLRPGQVGIPGHEASDTAYVLARRADILVICAPVGGDEPCLPQEAEILAHEEVRTHYVVRWLRGTEPYPYTFGPLVRVDSAALGVRIRADEVWLPALFWADRKTSPAELLDGRLVVHRHAGDIARLARVPVQAEGWVAHAETEPADQATASILDGGVELRFQGDAVLVGVRLAPNLVGRDAPARVLPPP